MAIRQGIGQRRSLSDLVTEERRVLFFVAPTNCELAESNAVECSKTDACTETLKPSVSARHHTMPDTHWLQTDL